MQKIYKNKCFFWFFGRGAGAGRWDSRLQDVALGLVLALGIFWGFLEMFELVPHVWAWWVLPVWAIGLGFAQLWQKVRDA